MMDWVGGARRNSYGGALPYMKPIINLAIHFDLFAHQLDRIFFHKARKECQICPVWVPCNLFAF